jgi:hypothetical protein
MELEKAALGASTACAHERTLALVSRPNGSSHDRRHVPRSACRPAGCAQPRDLRKLRPFQVLEQHRHSTPEHDYQIPARARVSHEVLNATELLERVTRDGELQLVAVGVGVTERTVELPDGVDDRLLDRSRVTFEGTYTAARVCRVVPGRPPREMRHGH